MQSHMLHHIYCEHYTAHINTFYFPGFVLETSLSLRSKQFLRYVTNNGHLMTKSAFDAVNRLKPIRQQRPNEKSTYRYYIILKKNTLLFTITSVGKQFWHFYFYFYILPRCVAIWLLLPSVRLRTKNKYIKRLLCVDI